ncbi:hypothetical protein DSL72_006188 [Monilinia vaccinii-corymbosi]|uniref:Uncharacterized protein n=1 Tax=Monilinia vaccinii-corymbosi TaxID=61207 RepID=A0A8A3PHV3_9HELO|nr:hypothetical protein DSL72_006188 [Monilinia vaccinii-corymbosi]
MPPQPKTPMQARRGGSNSNSKSTSTSKKPNTSTATKTPTTSTTTAPNPHPTKKRGPAKGTKHQHIPAPSFPIKPSNNWYENDEEECQCSSLDDDNAVAGNGRKHESRGVCEAERIRKVHVYICMSVILSSPHTTTLFIGPDVQPFTIYTDLLKLHTPYFSENIQLASSTPGTTSTSTDIKTRKPSSFPLPDFKIPKKVKVDEQSNQDSEQQLEIMLVSKREDCFPPGDVQGDVKGEVNLNTEEEINQEPNFKVEAVQPDRERPEIKREPTSHIWNTTANSVSRIANKRTSNRIRIFPKHPRNQKRVHRSSSRLQVSHHYPPQLRTFPLLDHDWNTNPLPKPACRTPQRTPYNQYPYNPPRLCPNHQIRSIRSIRSIHPTNLAQSPTHDIQQIAYTSRRSPNLFPHTHLQHTPQNMRRLRRE